VIVEPDVTAVALGPKDEFLVLATDGLWDVIDSQDVVSLARTNLRKGQSAQVGSRGCE
jgi:serine/threonine protein phosphatase PrpC